VVSEREQIEAWLTSVENRRFGYNGADKTVAGPMRRSLASLDAANARADEAEREVARLREALTAVVEWDAQCETPNPDCLHTWPTDPSSWCPHCTSAAALTPEDTQ
jgi:hypothetical protein